MRHGIIPPYLLARLAEIDDPARQDTATAARQTLAAQPPFRRARLVFSLDADTSTVTVELSDGPDRTISDAANTEHLPGRTVRREGDDPTGDPATDEAYEGLGATFALFAEVFDRNSIDDRGLPLDATVHYGDRYDNAFWNGRRMVFGDGDGDVFARFTASITVIGHELSHGVVQYTANLEYQGQSGALNESVADVFGSLVEQYALGQNVTTASWLIGEGIFTEAVQGRALRSMSEPGTAYDDDVLGRDPQPAHMDDYIETTEDYGGVHLNSGIPNRAFYLAAAALGGNAWQTAGPIWYRALTTDLAARADFADFAAATIAAATELHGPHSPERAAVASAWQSVGVTAHA